MLPASELAAVPAGLVWLAWGVFALGGYICVLNFGVFVSWLRWRLKPLPRAPYKHVSAIPILGSLLVALMLRTLGENPLALTLGIVFVFIDTGGLVWLFGGFVYMACQALLRKIR